MSRPIWKGNITFGLVNIPVGLYSATDYSDLHFHLLDSKNNARIHYERVNESTGETVPWDRIVKAYEFEKDNYVLVDGKELEKTAYENSETVEIEEFVDRASLEPIYFEKPYYLPPLKKSEKGYYLLREILEKTQKVGIARVVIRTRQYVAAVLPYKSGLLLNLLRYHQDIRDLDEYNLSQDDLKKYKLTAKEIEMAELLVENMSDKWNPAKYHDNNKELLQDWISNKIKRRKSVAEPGRKPSNARIVNFMDLLKKSIQKKKKEKIYRPPSSRQKSPPTPKQGSSSTQRKKKLTK